MKISKPEKFEKKPLPPHENQEWRTSKHTIVFIKKKKSKNDRNIVLNNNKYYAQYIISKISAEI